MIKNLRNKYQNSKIGSKKTSTQFVYFMSLFLLGWFAFGMLFKSTPEIETYEIKMMKVDVEKLTSKNIMADILIYGHTEASEKVELKIRTSGIVKSISNKKGKYVQKGDIILKLAMEDRMAKLRASQAAKDKAEIEFKTAQTLLKEQLISRLDYVASEANFKKVRASLDETILDIEHTVLRAPFNGVVNELNVEEGSYVSSGEDIGVFLNLNPIKIKAEIPEKYITQVRKGVVANVLLSSKQSIDAMLIYIGSVANTSTRTFSIELEANNKGDKIVEGLTAEIKFPLDTVSAMKITVSSCLTFGDDGTVGVKTINDDNIVEFYPIEIVKEEDGGLWVSGLPQEANVIVAGGEFVKTGAKVIPNFITDKALDFVVPTI